MSEHPAEGPDAVEAPEPTPPRRGGPFGFLRRGLARYVQFVARFRALGCLASLVLLLFVCGLVAFGVRQFGPRTEPFSELEQLPVNTAGTTIIAEYAEDDGATEYIDGMTSFDADKMWDAYDPSTQQELTSNGATIDGLRSGLAQAKENGAKIDGAERVGTYPLRDGRSYVFYVVRRSGFPPNGDAEELFFVFTLLPSGKIQDIT